MLFSSTQISTESCFFIIMLPYTISGGVKMRSRSNDVWLVGQYISWTIGIQNLVNCFKDIKLTKNTPNKYKGRKIEKILYIYLLFFYMYNVHRNTIQTWLSWHGFNTIWYSYHLEKVSLLKKKFRYKYLFSPKFWCHRKLK